ncbi:MAG TPA: rod shape-determining protein MreC [Thermoanaerobaculia bacterium]|nr:rod shape-determining protein MreC [Thermoanaerobaculia bacterium]
MQVAVERRPTLLLLIVLGVLFLLMSASTRTRTRVLGETRTLFERGVMTIFSPVPMFVNWVGVNASDIYHGYLDMRRTVSENLQLRREVQELAKDNLMLRRSVGDLARMRALLGYSEQFSMPTLLSKIVMLDTSGRFKSIILDRGSDAGVEINDPLVNADGLIGRVVLTTRDLSKVQLIIDANASVGCLIERNRRQGIVRGDARGGLRMDFVPSLTDVAPGDRILTAGIDGIYPKGIVVGHVSSVEEGKDLFKSIAVTPSVDFMSLEEVIILHSRKIPPEVVRYQP